MLCKLLQLGLMLVEAAFLVSMGGFVINSNNEAFFCATHHFMSHHHVGQHILITWFPNITLAKFGVGLGKQYKKKIC